jgi:Tetracyclin repressor-like, C-terminal domain
VFILATTAPEALPPTILSHCQRYAFRRPSDTLREIFGGLSPARSFAHNFDLRLRRRRTAPMGPVGRVLGSRAALPTDISGFAMLCREASLNRKIRIANNYWAGTRLDILADKSIALIERLRQHFEHMASRYKKFGFEYGCLVTKFTHEVSDSTHLLQTDLRRQIGMWTALITETIREGQADGRVGLDIIRPFVL